MTGAPKAGIVVVRPGALRRVGLKATEAPLNRGFFATRSLTEKRVPPMRREGAAVEASAASGAAASVALAEA
jgi:hypothetical protein